MTNKPTYTASDIKKMALVFEYDVYSILLEQINDELDRYSAEELVTIIEASMIIFIKTLLHSTLIK